MCWRNNVRWGVHQDDDAKNFMTVTSDEYVLAIPDYSHQAREKILSGQDVDSISSTSSHKNVQESGHEAFRQCALDGRHCI